MGSGAVDIFLVYSFVKRLVQPFKDWEAYKLGIIDETGKVIKKRDTLTFQEKQAWGYFDVLVCNLKKLLAKVPGGSSNIATYGAAVLLLKEHKHLHKELTENEDLLMRRFSNEIRLAQEQGVPESVDRFIQENCCLRNDDNQIRRKKEGYFQENQEPIKHPDDIIAIHNNIARRKGLPKIEYGSYGKKLTAKSREELANRLEYANSYKKPAIQDRINRMSECLGGAPINNVGGGNIAGTDNNPPVRKRKPRIMRRKIQELSSPMLSRYAGAARVSATKDPVKRRQREKGISKAIRKVFSRRKKELKYESLEFGGHPVFEVDTGTFMKCRMGKRKHAHYETYIGETDNGQEIREYGLSNPGKPIIIQDRQTGSMMFLRYGGKYDMDK